MLVVKLECWELGLHFIPKAPYPKSFAMFINIMKQYEPTRAEFGTPGGEVVGYGFVCVQTIHVEDVNCAIFKTLNSFIERHRRQGRERRIQRIVMAAQVGQHRWAV